MYATQIIRSLETFEPISLKEMSSVQLMNRVDTKYIIPVEKLPEFLELGKQYYYCQDINGVRAASYDTIYFDTKDIEMYTAHHNRKKTRIKIRKRCYVESDLAFLEIKQKNNKGRTNKIRIRTIFEPSFDSNESSLFVEQNTRYKREDLIPQINVKFNRITLVNKEKTERLTIDFDIRFDNLAYHYQGGIPELCIVEIKQSGYCFSHFRDILKQNQIHRQNMSKYCLGTILTNPDAKYNFFKKKLYYISKTVKVTNIKTNNQKLQITHV